MEQTDAVRKVLPLLEVAMYVGTQKKEGSKAVKSPITPLELSRKVGETLVKTSFPEDVLGCCMVGEQLTGRLAFWTNSFLHGGRHLTKLPRRTKRKRPSE